MIEGPPGYTGFISSFSLITSVRGRKALFDNGVSSLMALRSERVDWSIRKLRSIREKEGNIQWCGPACAPSHRPDYKQAVPWCALVHLFGISIQICTKKPS